MPSIPESDEVVVSDIHMVLVSFINENPVAWAPTISTWSLELLGETSSKYAGRAQFSSSKYVIFIIILISVLKHNSNIMIL